MKQNSYERRDYAAVAGKQQFSIARTKLPPLGIAGGNGLKFGNCASYINPLPPSVLI